MHFIEIAESGDNQTVEVISNSRHECIMAYLKRNAWNCKAPNSLERLTDGRLLVEYNEEVCIMQAVTEQVVTALWMWKADTM